MKNKFNIGDRVVSKEYVADFIVDRIEIYSAGVVYYSKGGFSLSEHKLELAPKTETYYQYVYKSLSGYKCVSSSIYKSDEDFQKAYLNFVTWFQKLPTPIEVPCE